MPVFRIVCAIGFALGLSLASPHGGAAGEGDATDARVAVVVLLDTQPLATYRGGIRGLAATAPAVTGGRLDVRSRAATAYRAHVDRRLAAFESAAPTSIPRAVPLYRYDVILGGVAMQVHESDLPTLAALPGVRRVIRDVPRSIDTDKSPAFVGAPKLWTQLGGAKSAGEGVVVGVLDTGIWPEHPSFADPDPADRKGEEPGPLPYHDRPQLAAR